MASRRVEDRHKKAVDRILSESGLVCKRSPSVSAQPSVASLTSDEPLSTEADSETSLLLASPEESPESLFEEPSEEEKIFPTPSLRKLLPDNIRKAEEHNRIHVLPKEFKTNIDPLLIPKIVPQVKYIDIIAELLGCKSYKNSLAEFWFLDTMANLLRRAQEDLLPRTIQAVLMLWFCEWMKEIQNFDAADRKRMLRRFKVGNIKLETYEEGQIDTEIEDNMLSAARFIAESEEPRLPTPEEAGVRYKALEEDADNPIQKKDPKSQVTMAAKTENIHKYKTENYLVTFKECAYECAMRDLVTIMHYIFDLFSTDYQFDLVRSVFTFTPEYNLIDVPHPLQTPKRMFAPFKPKKEKPKKEPKKEPKGKKKEPDTEEFIALMELKAKEERELEELELKDAEAWNMRKSILPLTLAGTDELFDKYWPPPPPEPEPEPVPEPKKGKKKK